MPGLATQQLVLIKGTPSAADKGFYIGTGYFVTADLVLTASHVVPEEDLDRLQVRTESDGQWREAERQPVWRDAALDAVLIRTQSPLANIPQVGWVETEFDDDVAWQSSGYPDAGIVEKEGERLWKTVALKGEINRLGGGGQGSKELELEVKAPPPAEQWAGISGAPIFVDGRLAGMIKEAPKSFQGGRLAGVPATVLLQNHAFRLALSPAWLDPLPNGVWVLVVTSEGKKQTSKLADWVDGSLKPKDEEAIGQIKGALGAELQSIIRVKITDALESPGKWLRFVRALCKAPIAIFDATGFEPAVMLALGVRAVVRRGVTLTSSADLPTPEELSKLPFNIQETKLLYHGSEYPPVDFRHPLNQIAVAVKKGWQELVSQPNYLDLPAYDAVRCPYPTTDANKKSSVTRVLVLCSFSKDHNQNWNHLANALASHFGLNVARMIDVSSPRLVGQALYEGIRWARACVIDWTGWRANVFFELGVRLACADVGPVGLIERGAADDTAARDAPVQRQLLMALFGPTVYRLAEEDDGVKRALVVHDAILGQRAPALAATQLPHDATFRTCQDWFAWEDEHITIEPHELLRSSIEAPFGKDPQAFGRKPILFSGNPAYDKGLDRSVKDRWIAAWCYLSQRYPKTYWKRESVFRATLRTLGKQVILQAALRETNEEHLKALCEQIDDVIDELDNLDKRDRRQTMQGPAHVDGN
jgi:hypothetical protein